MEIVQLVGELAQYGLGFVYAVVILSLFIQGKLTTEHRVLDWKEIAKTQETRANRLEEALRNTERRDEKIAASMEALNTNLLLAMRNGRETRGGA